jgi:hypothetical protein
MEGFQDSLEMWKHFENAYGLPFSGVLTIWDPESFIEGDPSATAQPENPVHAV